MDVVERLRQFGPEWSKKFGGHIIPYEVCVQAADEIERLRTLLNAARKHIDHEEQPYLAREISTALDFNSNLSG